MAKIKLNLGRKENRSCDNCTACCEGWLTANIKGEEMYPGKPCQFVECGVGCNIYKDRPNDPCKQFRCMWRDTDSKIMPDEYKPSEIKSIVVPQNFEGHDYLSLVECGVAPKPDVVSWFVSYVVSRGMNAHWTVNGKPYCLGSKEFVQAMARRDFGQP